MSEVAERSALRIQPGVVEKIAIEAASEIDAVGGTARRVLNVTLGSDNAAEHALASAQINGNIVTLQVTCSMEYPAPLRKTAAALRSHLAGRIEAMTGLQVRRIDVSISSLTLDGASKTRRVVT